MLWARPPALVLTPLLLPPLPLLGQTGSEGQTGSTEGQKSTKRVQNSRQRLRIRPHGAGKGYGASQMAPGGSRSLPEAPGGQKGDPGRTENGLRGQNLPRDGALGPKKGPATIRMGPWGPKRAPWPPYGAPGAPWGPWGPMGPLGAPWGPMGPYGPVLHCGDCAEGACYARLTVAVSWVSVWPRHNSVLPRHNMAGFQGSDRPESGRKSQKPLRNCISDGEMS